MTMTRIAMSLFAGLIATMICGLVAAAADKPTIYVFTQAPDYPYGNMPLNWLDNNGARGSWTKERISTLTVINGHTLKKPITTCSQFLKAVGGGMYSDAFYAAAEPFADFDACALMGEAGWATPTANKNFFGTGEQPDMDQEIVDHLDLTTLRLRDVWGLSGRKGPIFSRDLHPDDVKVRVGGSHGIEITKGHFTLGLMFLMAADFERGGNGPQEVLATYTDDERATRKGQNNDTKGYTVLLTREGAGGTISAKPVLLRAPRFFDIFHRYDTTIHA